MRIKRLRLHHFRNYESLDLPLTHDLTVIYGKNAQGKTNLLEGLYFAAMGFSFRTRHDDEVALFGSEAWAAEVTFEDRYGENKLLVKKVPKNGRRKKEILLNGVQVSPKEQYGRLNLVLFTPDDLQLVKGDPALRRRFLDMEIAQTNRLYYEFLQNYNRVLQQRNKFLKQCREMENLDESQLGVWDRELAAVSANILQERLKAMDDISTAASSVHGAITEGKEQLTLQYLEKQVEGEQVLKENRSQEEWAAFYREELKARHQLDYLRGYTSIGPHRDDLVILENGRPLKAFGSQGQQRTAALALKLSELEFIYKSKEEYPVLLLDDVLSELDASRRRMLLEGMGGKVQTLLTVNDRSLAASGGDCIFYEVREGKLREGGYEGV
ncbi:MAG: DNA replication/repair protein RecF [Acidaminococcus sp.]|jgi:DNA replication and repair protein RecF|nr:DNA replication/repair protein RecF [Acidaminococcus sp.]MCI2100749.1 DNA replication/repair protein RecF [Acidaminococcus sp.]MCI2115070.1 DNA replication/repair protein RecF [Acidaminococcus sp.]MCI2117146.1 DNA replication/repair protein RecF [Acidaminococcus sp.]